ncbi:MAG: glycoside hydrolase family 1 protein [bacterium]|nr:glycoside hydrolase family 1 protein [bacterium]
MKLGFPKGFLWGAATSSHQVEGNNHNDWTEWELKNAERLSKESGGKYPPENFISGRACDHYNRFREDFDIAKSLNHNAHRFSIEWSRIEPEEGKWDEKEIEHYREVISALRERGIEPFVTLWHWTLPLWVAKQGGWENKKTVEDFTKYSERMAKEFGDIKYWITINESKIYSINTHLRGKWPPQKRTLPGALKTYRNILLAHKRVYSKIHRAGVNVGIAKNNSYFEGWASPLVNYLWNDWFLKRIKNHQDFIGLNYYFHNRIRGFKFNQNENKKISDFGWEIYPEGIYYVLKDLKKYNKPIYITENGLADAKDIYRADFIKEHLRWTHKAISEGVDVRGYLHWSLLDNFEWHQGFWPRFGLVEMDYKTMERRIRQSATVYAKIAKENLLEV